MSGSLLRDVRETRNQIIVIHSEKTHQNSPNSSRRFYPVSVSPRLDRQQVVGLNHSKPTD